MTGSSARLVDIRRIVFGTLVLILLAGTAIQSAVAAKSSVLTLQSSPNPALTTDVITISGRLSGDGQALSRQTVKVEYSTDQSTWAKIASPSTGPDGGFSTTWKPVSQGQFYLRATFGGNKKFGPSSNVVIQQVNSPAPPAPITEHVGVNYLTLYHRYDTPTETLQRDFAKFKSDGISTVVVAVFWYRLESSRGVYNQQFLNNVIRVCNVAAQYGLEVMIDFHTLIQDSDAWSNPAYVGAGMNLITDATIASSYVAMVTWTVNQLKGVSNIWSYAVLNEPWYWPLDDWRKSNWINLMVELSGVVRQTGKPVTVRFVGALFERDWGWDSRIISALDFISLNAYVIKSTTDDVYWNNFDEYTNGLLNVAQKAASLGKPVQITEFGSEEPDNDIQADEYRAYTDAFRATQNLIGWFCWGWDRGYDPSNPTWSAVGAFSVIDPVSGTARPSYSILVQNR